MTEKKPNRNSCVSRKKGWVKPILTILIKYKRGSLALLCCKWAGGGPQGPNLTALACGVRISQQPSHCTELCSYAYCS